LQFSGTDLLLNALRHVHGTYLNLAPDISQALKEKTEELSDLVKEAAEKTNKSNGITRNTPITDPGWFQGLETNAKTKEDFLKKRAQDRIRGYLYKFQEEMKKSPMYKESPSRDILSKCVAGLRKRLSEDEYFGCYFDRRCAAVDSIDGLPMSAKKVKMAEKECKHTALCDVMGLFLCEGLWKESFCQYKFNHQINPYNDRESRILFSTWNLDHRLVPCVLEYFAL